MKTIILGLMFIMMSVAAQASCHGGKEATFCHQLSKVGVGQTEMTGEAVNQNRFNISQLSITRNGNSKEVVDRVACEFDLLKINNKNPTVCTSAHYLYTVVAQSTTLTGSDPYFIGAQALVQVSTQDAFGLMIQKLATGENEVLGCQTVILCP